MGREVSGIGKRLLMSAPVVVNILVLVRACFCVCHVVLLLFAAEACCNGSTWDEAQVRHYQHW